MATAKINHTVTIGVQKFTQQVTKSGPGQLNKDINAPAALTGTLTTRTNNTDGTITITGTNTVTNGALIDIYWSGGSRRNVVAGTVSGQLVPITLGAGDNLPNAFTALQVALIQNVPATFAGDDVVALGLQDLIATSIGWFRFLLANGNEAFSIKLDNAVPYLWNQDNGVVNPIAAQAIASISVSHNDTAKVHTMSVGLLLAK